MIIAVRSVGGLFLGAACVLWLGIAGSCNVERGPDRVTETSRPLNFPVPGEIMLAFSNDALGNPLSRGTVLGEQYAAWGIHFTGGYIIGDLETDFPDYHFTPPNNLICTPDASVHTATVVSWIDGRCGEGHAPAPGVPLGISLDFAACWVSVIGYNLADSSPDVVPGTVQIKGFDASGAPKGTWSSRDISPTIGLDSSGDSVFAAPGSGWVSLPPSPFGFPFPQVIPDPTLDVHRVEISDRTLGAFDFVTVVPCDRGGAGGLGGSNAAGGMGGWATATGGIGGATSAGGGSAGAVAVGGTTGSPGGANGGSGIAGAGGDGAGPGGGDATGGGDAGSGGSAGAGQGGRPAGGGGLDGRGGAAGGHGVHSGGEGGGIHMGRGCSIGPDADRERSPWPALAVAAAGVLAVRPRRRSGR